MCDATSHSRFSVNATSQSLFYVSDQTYSRTFRNEKISERKFECDDWMTKSRRAPRHETILQCMKLVILIWSTMSSVYFEQFQSNKKLGRKKQPKVFFLKSKEENKKKKLLFAMKNKKWCFKHICKKPFIIHHFIRWVKLFQNLTSASEGRIFSASRLKIFKSGSCRKRTGWPLEARTRLPSFVLMASTLFNVWDVDRGSVQWWFW